MDLKSVVKNILVIIAGVVVGSIVNMSLVNVGYSVVPLSEGADVSTMESLQESMKLFTPVNFLFPFLAHALGTLVAAFIAARFTGSHHMSFALGIGVFFLMGGIAAVIMFGGPLWFKVVDLLVAYIPMSYLGAILADKTRPSAS